MTKPISPNEIAAAKVKHLPAFVFEAFNELIAENFTAGSAVVSQTEAILRILSKSPCTPRSDVFTLGYLNVEESYRAEGWGVEYDKPAYYEVNGGATFTFRPE